MRVYEKCDGVMLEDVSWFEPAVFFDCGQCFRFLPCGENVFRGVTFDRPLQVEKQDDGFFLFPCTLTDFETIWRNFFDLDRDYAAICDRICADDVHLQAAAPCCEGLRLLSQDPFETLISFIISANNNISRIRSIIEKLCAAYGERLLAPWGEVYAFPKADALAKVPVEELRALGLGYRDRYVKETSQMVADDPAILDRISQMPYMEAQKALCQFPGVGKKVADCIALFSMNKREAFPKDVWIRRVANEVYACDPDTLAARFGDEAGFAQQMMFYTVRKK